METGARRGDQLERVQARHKILQNLAAQTTWCTEYHFADETPRTLLLGHQYAIEQELARARSDNQDIRIVKNPVYGRMLIIDDCIMVTEHDECTYHEMLGHVPMLEHGAVQDVLIVGGGDGGLAREILKHPRVRRIDLVELDGTVIDLCRCYLPTMGCAFDDDRVNIYLQDGARFVRETDLHYDLVVVDSTDPIGPGKALFTRGFYRACRAILRPGGLFAAQGLSPWLQRTEQESMLQNIREVWSHCSPFTSTVPTYAAGLWLFALAADGPLRQDPHDRAVATEIARSCRYYNPALHHAAFCLPNLLLERLSGRQ